MQCLYCGKELALLKRLTGSEFCSDAHKRSYQEEYNRLAVNRLLQAQPKGDAAPDPLRANRYTEPEAEAPEFLAGKKRAIEAPKEEPKSSRVFYQAPAVTEPPPVVEPRSQPEPHPAAAEPAHQPAPATQPELVPVGMAAFIRESIAIRDSELKGDLSVNGPCEWNGRTHYPSFHPLAQPAMETPHMAEMVGYEAGLSMWADEPAAPVGTPEVKEFSSAPLSMNIPTRPSRPRGLGSAEKIRFSVSARKAQDSACEWKTETADFVFHLSFRETARSGSPAEIGFPEELAGLAEALRPAIEVPAGPEPEQEQPEADLDGSPRAALEALVKLKEEVDDSPRHRGKRNNGTAPAHPEAEPVIDTEALEWLFNETPDAPPEPAAKPSRSRRRAEQPAAAPDTAPVPLAPAAEEAQLAAVASVPVSPVAVEEAEPEAVPAEVQLPETSPQVPKAPQFVTIPMKVFVPSKAKLAPGSHAVTGKPEPELPRIEALPMRPKMSLTSAPPVEAAVNGFHEPETVETSSSVAEPEAAAATASAEQITEPAPSEPPTATASRPVFEKAPTATAASEPKRNVWKTTTILKTDDSPGETPVARPAAKPESDDSGAKIADDSEVAVPGFSFSATQKSSFWGALPIAAKITIAAIIVIIVAAVIYLTSFSHKSTASTDAAGPSIMVGEGGWITDWAGDATGLHRGRQITIYKPSLTLSDYRIAFQGRVENASIGWVFRAADASNYYVMKLTQASSGFKLTKYAVINGQEHEQASVAVPQPSAGWFSIRVDVRGAKFSTFIDGKAIDVWTDEQLKAGGVGFLNDRGERADIKGIAISYLAGVGK
jgi:hypothetical protein